MYRGRAQCSGDWAVQWYGALPLNIPRATDFTFFSSTFSSSTCTYRRYAKASTSMSSKMINAMPRKCINVPWTHPRPQRLGRPMLRRPGSSIVRHRRHRVSSLLIMVIRLPQRRMLTSRAPQHRLATSRCFASASPQLSVSLDTAMSRAPDGTRLDSSQCSRY